MRVEHRLTATRSNRRLTLSEVADFVRWCESTGVHPASEIKASTSVGGWLRSLDVAPHPQETPDDH